MAIIGDASSYSAPVACAMTVETVLLKLLEAFYFWSRITMMTPRRASTAWTPALLCLARREVGLASEWTASVFIIITGRSLLKIEMEMKAAASLLRGCPYATGTRLVGDATHSHLKTVILTHLTRLRWTTTKFGLSYNGDSIGDIHHNSSRSLQNRNISRALLQ